jgi:hypothetical protein
MSPEFIEKWEKLLEGVEKEVIPLHFIKKFILKLKGRKRHSINIQKLLEAGVSTSQIEEIITEKIVELDDQVIGIEFILNVKSIAEEVQPETDKLLNGL